MVGIFLTTDACTKAGLLIVKLTGREVTLIRSRVTSILEIGKVMCRMEVVDRNLAMGRIIKVSLKMGSRMEEVIMYANLECTRVSLKKEVSMEKAVLVMKMGECIRDNGRMDCCMVMGFLHGLMVIGMKGSIRKD